MSKAKEPKSIEDILGEASIYVRLGQYEDAIHSYEEALKLNPNSIPALEQKGLCLMRVYRYNDAINCFSQIIGLNNNHSLASEKIEACLQEIRQDSAVISNPSRNDSSTSGSTGSNTTKSLYESIIDAAINGINNNGKELKPLRSGAVLNEKKHKELVELIRKRIEASYFTNELFKPENVKILTFHVAKVLQLFMNVDPKEKHIHFSIKETNNSKKTGILFDTSLRTQIDTAIANAKREMRPERNNDGSSIPIDNDDVSTILPDESASAVGNETETVMLMRNDNYSSAGASTILNQSKSEIPGQLYDVFLGSHNIQKKHDAHPMAQIETGCGARANAFATCMNAAMQIMYAKAYDTTRAGKTDNKLVMITDYASRAAYAIPGVGTIAGTVVLLVNVITKYFDEKNKQLVYNAMERGASTEYTIRITAEKAGQRLAKHLDRFPAEKIQYLAEIIVERLFNNISSITAESIKNTQPKDHMDLYLKAIASGGTVSSDKLTHVEKIDVENMLKEIATSRGKKQDSRASHSVTLSSNNNGVSSII